MARLFSAVPPIRALFIVCLLVSASRAVDTATPAQCVDCHTKTTPNIVSDWKLSKHSGVDVSCVTCHGDQHTSAADVAKAKVPTPDTCAQCHETQVAQFHKGKHAMAWASMKAMPTIHWQPMAMTEGEKGCGGCHKIGDKTVAEIAELRKNGSGTEFGAAQCDACHTRHTFSVEEAKSPQACETCHMGFDHPQWEMYSASKHGVRHDLKQKHVLPAMPPPQPARPATCRMAITKFAPPGDSSPCACLCPKTSSGPPIAPPSFRHWVCSIRKASPQSSSMS